MRKRKIDQVVSENFAKLGKKFSLVKKGKIQKLKASILVAFALGTVVAIVWGFSSGQYSKLDAYFFGYNEKSNYDVQHGQPEKCAKQGEKLRNESLGPKYEQDKPTVCCDGLKAVYPTTPSSGNRIVKDIVGAAATCQKIKAESARKGEAGQAGLYPKGSYAMWDPSQPIPDEIINNPDIVGILAAANWKDIEKEKDKYDWSGLDTKISQAEKAGLKVALKFVDSPAASPDWIMNNSQIEKITVVDTNEYHTGKFNKEITLPVFWDSTFHQQRKNFIQEAGKRYANNKTVVAIMASFANLYTCEWYIPTEMLKSPNYSTEKMFRIGQEIIDTTATAFPNQALKLPIEPRDLTLVQETIDYAYAKYPNRFFAQTNGLSTIIPLADSSEVSNAAIDGKTGAYFILKLLKQHSPQIGLQMLSAASLCKEGEACRQDKANKCQPNDHKCILTESVNIGISYNPQYIEYWKEDAMNTELYDILAKFTNNTKTNIECRSYTDMVPPCAGGTIVPGVKGSDGCYGPPTCKASLEVTCANYPPPSQCPKGTIVTGPKDSSGCYTYTCQKTGTTCQNYPPPNWCLNGTIITGSKNSRGCTTYTCTTPIQTGVAN
jgi:hypothetical protein